MNDREKAEFAKGIFPGYTPQQIALAAIRARGMQNWINYQTKNRLGKVRSRMLV